MTLREHAKEVYVSLRAQGRGITATELARRSVEFLGESVAYPTINRWSWQGGWNKEFAVAETDDEIVRFVDLIADVYDGIEMCDNAKDMASFCRSFYYILMNLPNEMLLAYQDTISDVREEIYRCLHDGTRGVVYPAIQATLIRTYVDLKKYAIVIPEGAEGYDVDAMLMGMEE